MRPVGTAEELERRRRRAVELVKQGEHPAQVAHFLGCGRSSVYTWVKLGRDAAEKLAARPHTGPKPRLTDEQAKELEGLLLKGAKAHGWPNELWSAHRVAEVIRRHFGVVYHVEHARKVIRRRLNWSGQKPQKRAKQRNAEKIDH
jgi:transposase